MLVAFVSSAARVVFFFFFFSFFRGANLSATDNSVFADGLLDKTFGQDFWTRGESLLDYNYRLLGKENKIHFSLANFELSERLLDNIGWQKKPNYGRKFRRIMLFWCGKRMWQANF